MHANLEPLAGNPNDEPRHVYRQPVRLLCGDCGPSISQSGKCLYCEGYASPLKNMTLAERFKPIGDLHQVSDTRHPFIDLPA
jgi:hypothetical protein